MLLLSNVPPLAAQLQSVPVYAVTTARPGWALAADYGTGLNDASGHARHVGGRVTGPAGPFRLTAAAGAWDAGSRTSAQLGGTAGLSLGIVGGSLSLLAMVGAGFARAGPRDTATTYWTFPAGVALIRPGSGTGRPAITPWLFPRAQMIHVSFARAHINQLGVGLSAGVSAALTDRLGVHGAVDWLYLARRSGGLLTLEGGTRVTAGLGVDVHLARSP